MATGIGAGKEVILAAEGDGAQLFALEWGARLRCSKCGSHDTDFVVCGYSLPNE